jgi:hypothetical protein
MNKILLSIKILEKYSREMSEYIEEKQRTLTNTHDVYMKKDIRDVVRCKTCMKIQ